MRISLLRSIGLASLFMVMFGITACRDVDPGPDVPVAIEFNVLPFPSIVAGDSLRDTAGVVQPLQGIAYNVRGDTLHDFPLRYIVLDTGITVDSVTGRVYAQNLRATPARIVVQARALQSPPLSLVVIQSPDTIAELNDLDTLRYNLVDTTKNVSASLTVQLFHKNTPQNTPVQAYPVFFEMIYPTDTTWAQVIGDAQRRSLVDTTDATGTAGRSIRIRPAALTSLEDSVVLMARVKYLNAPVAGSPIRLVLRVLPPAP